MNYSMKTVFKIPISDVKELLDNFGENSEEILNNKNLIKRILISYIINKYFEEISEKEYEDLFNNSDIKYSEKYFYVILNN